MSFLSNPRSAKLRNSYVNGFLDCSGDIVLRSGNVIIGNISQPGYNANQQSLLIHGRTQMNGNLIVNGNLLVSSNNIALGLRAGNIVNGIQDGVPNGLNSTAVGSFSGMNHTGQNNTFMGSVAGQASSTTYFSRTGNNNTYVGHRTSASQSAWADSTAVGTGAVITASNQIVLGTTAETVSIPGKIYASNLASSYNSANASGADSWVRVGVFSAPQSGYICVIKIYGNQGYNATINQNYIATIYFKTGNGSSVNATGFAADSHYYIESSSIGNSVFIIGDPIWIANAAGLSATTYTLFLNLPAHASGTHYTVNISPNGLCSWVDSYSFGTAPASQISSSTCLLSTSSYGIKGNSIAIGLGALTTTSNQIVLGTTAYTVTVPRNLGLVSTTAVSYTQTSSLGFGYGGGSTGTPYRWKIDDVTLNRDNGAGPNYDYGVQSSLYFRRKTNNLYSGGANDTTYTDSLILSGDGSAFIPKLSIGTTTPVNDLTVATTTNGGGITISGTTNTSILLTSTGSAGSGVVRSATISMKAADTTDRALQFFNSSTDLVTADIAYKFLSKGAAYRVGITEGGNVGIGTTTPAYALDVNGTAAANSILIKNTSYSTTLANQVYTANTWYTAIGVNQLEQGSTYVIKLVYYASGTPWNLYTSFLLLCGNVNDGGTNSMSGAAVPTSIHANNGNGADYQIYVRGLMTAGNSGLQFKVNATTSTGYWAVQAYKIC